MIEVKHLLHMVGKVSFCQGLDISDKTLPATSVGETILEAVKTVLL